MLGMLAGATQKPLDPSLGEIIDDQHASPLAILVKQRRGNPHGRFVGRLDLSVFDIQIERGNIDAPDLQFVRFDEIRTL